MIVLVRDPRAVFSSRWSGRIAEWCRNDHCSDPATACGDLMEDVEAARRLTAELDGKVRLVRYEDLSLNTLDTAKEIFRFLQLPWHSSVRNYILSHTRPARPHPSHTVFSHNRRERKIRTRSSTKALNSATDPYGTIRNSTATVMSWVSTLSSSSVSHVQDSCSAPMSALGYKPVNITKNKSLQLADILVTGDKWRLE